MEFRFNLLQFLPPSLGVPPPELGEEIVGQVQFHQGGEGEDLCGEVRESVVGEGEGR